MAASTTEILVAALLVGGGSFALLGSWALARLGDFYKRLHGPTKATTLGVGSILLASSLWFSLRGPSVSLRELLIAVFLALTAPVSAHLLARAVLRLDPAVRPPEPPRGPRPSEVAGEKLEQG
jgi:multicomponent K+:H+ antiporter subunit G